MKPRVRRLTRKSILQNVDGDGFLVIEVFKIEVQTMKDSKDKKISRLLYMRLKQEVHWGGRLGPK